jgi:hypothetical protein
VAKRKQGACNGKDRMLIRGSCCCGEVVFSIDTTPTFMAECYCSRCRKLGSTPFVMIPSANLLIERGRDQIVVFPPESPFKYKREFCGLCGTSLGEITSNGDLIPIPANSFDDPLELPIRFVEHAATKPPWATLPEGVKVFEGDPG